MKLEIKTNKQIIYDTCYLENNVLKFFKSKINKKWVSVESMIKWLQNDQWKTKDDLLKQLKGEQESK